MNEALYLDLEDLLHLIRRLGIGPVVDVGLLDSACARPRSSVLGEDAYRTIDLKAAALLHSLASNHPLLDGNKRLAWLATVVFLDLNGRPIAIDHDDAFQIVIDVAEGLSDLEVIAQRLRGRERGATTPTTP